MNEAIPPVIQSSDAILRSVLSDVLSIDAERVATFEEDTALFGALPELDSQAVAGLLTEIEDRMGFIIEDEDVEADMLETYGALLRFVMDKRND